jgi:hypothetical protein
MLYVLHIQYTAHTLLQNPTPDVIVAKGATSYDGEQGSNLQEPRCESLHGTEAVTAVSQMIPSGRRAAPPRMYAFYPYGALRVVTG